MRLICWIGLIMQVTSDLMVGLRQPKGEILEVSENNRNNAIAVDK